MRVETVRVPDMGTTEPVDVIELLVQEGVTVTPEASLLVLESAKASVELPSPVAGKVVRLHVKVGERVQTGDALLDVEVAGDEGAPVALPGKPVERPAAVETVRPAASADVARQTPVSTPPSVTTGLVHAGPAVRKLARQLGVDLAQVQGSGPHGRLLKEDLFAQVARQLRAAGLPPLPEIDFSRFGAIEKQATSGFRRTLAQHLQQGWNSIPQVTQHDTADITRLDAWRRKENLRNPGRKLSLLAQVAQAVIAALKAFPRFNASLAEGGNTLVLKRYIHLGFAVDTERGLLVPVLKDADRLEVAELSAAIATLADKARGRKLFPADLEGASFSITSLGSIGGGHFTPLVNAPEVAILGIGRAGLQPVWVGDAQAGHAEPGLILPLSLSYDHRVVDGADAARFLVFLKQQLEAPAS